ncbi:hypothetical protein FCIRC_13327 [Fusarium circinatum]|uniref:Apple domain-containing protein n=1 Tax=Fusarium circinatum TaxID=48490 RepID=A0A8H5SP48_FUSCI|nr:hypothetical protein FCIRC_13327 [Fusarium circinatum]
MKTLALYMSLVLIRGANTQEACEEGRRVTISPSYTVEYKCGKYRMGRPYNNVMSHEDCAAICEASDLEVCTYKSASKLCIVGDPNGAEGTHSAYTYMVRVPEGSVDPFPESCEEQKDDLRRRLDEAERQLNTCRANCGTPSPVPAPAPAPICGINKASSLRPIRNLYNIPLANCKMACNADTRCLSYSTSNRHGMGICSLYDQECKDSQLQPTVFPNLVTYDKRCG